MVCMIADYKQNGNDMHKEYIATNTNDYEIAVREVYNDLVKSGCSVSGIVVLFGEYTMTELKRMSAFGPKPGATGIAYVFDIQ